jgi:polyferredoxin
MKTGKNLNVIRLNATLFHNALKTFYQRGTMRQRLQPEELHARLIVAIGIILAIVFAGSVFSLLYAFLFITQPLGEQAPNDKAAIDLVSTLCVFLTGTLAGIVSANGLKSKKKEDDK